MQSVNPSDLGEAGAHTHRLSRSSRMIILRCEAVIFDLDGVLVDSAEAIAHHWKTWATRNDVDSEHLLRVAQGRRTLDTLAIVAPHLDADQELARLALAESTDLSGVQPFPNAWELVHNLEPDQWAVATSGTRAVAEARLNHVGLPIPSVLVTADQITRGKPDPEGFTTAARLLRKPAESCIVIEDSPPGVEAAHTACMRCVAVATTHVAVQLAGAHFTVAGLDRVATRQAGGSLELCLQQAAT